jgi:predicted transcriptional regulator
MGMVSIRVSRDTHERLRELADREHRPMSSVAESAVRTYEKEQRWIAAEAAMARLQANPDAWHEYLEEAEAWDATLLDGLDELPYEVERE